MNTKKVPVFIMLLAGAVACIVTYLDHYDLHDMLVVLLTVLILFLIIGLIAKKILDKFEISNIDQVDDEGEVVEKNGEEEGKESGPDEGEEESIEGEDSTAGGDGSPDQGV